MFLDMDTYAHLIPKALKKARERAGLSIEEIAQRTKISIPAIGNYEWGKNLPLMPYFLCLLDLYKLDLTQFHELLMHLYYGQVHQETARRIGDLEQRIKTLEEATTARAQVG